MLSNSGRGVLFVLLGLLAGAPACRSGAGGNETQDAGTGQPGPTPDAGTHEDAGPAQETPDAGGPDAGTSTDAGVQATVPAAPSAPTAAQGIREATVTWSAPDNGGSPITRYTVTALPGAYTTVVSGTSALVRGLTPGTAYTFTVFATNDVGDGPPSSPSNEVIPRQVCPEEASFSGPHARALPMDTGVQASARLVDSREAVLIRYREGASPTLRAWRHPGSSVKREWRELRLVAARVTPADKQALASDPAVLSIEPDRPVHALGLPAPAPSGSIGEYTPGLQLVQAPAVWDADQDGVLNAGAPTGQGIKVCVIDSGIDFRHPELRIPYAGGRDFVEDDDDPSDLTGDTWGLGHGTRVAAVLAAQFGNAGQVDPHDPRMDPGGVVGVAPGVSLLIARVLDTRGNGTTSDVIAALSWCKAQGARIVSFSLGSPIASPAEEDAFAWALENGMLSIASAGNDGNDQPLTYPAAYPSVLAVGAVDFDKRLAPFSHTGSGLSLVAPGVDILSASIVDGRIIAKELSAGGQSFEASPLEFTPVGEYTGPLVDCGLGDSMSACQSATCSGFVALVRRGGVSFAEKARNVRAQGARALVITHTVPTEGTGEFTLGEPSPDWRPSVSVSYASGLSLAALVGRTATVNVSTVDYAHHSGTSMATPHVSGAAALVWSARPELGAAQVRQALEASALDLGAAGRDPQYGFGLVQARRALERLDMLFPR